MEAAVDRDLSDHYARTALLCASVKGYDEIASLLQAPFSGDPSVEAE